MLLQLGALQEVAEGEDGAGAIRPVGQVVEDVEPEVGREGRR